MNVKVGYKRKQDRSGSKTMLAKIALSSGIGLALFASLLLLAAVVCLRIDNAAWIVPLSAFLCCAAAAFPTGCIAARSVGKSGMLCGLLATLPTALFLLILCLSLNGTIGSGYWIGIALILCFGALGGISALNFPRRKRYR